ncbi:MAG: sugar phosphate isomerase/epimerase [Prolixibacteraceae bacterium]|nr:sugar phosphate isomerase/epimerase [Prolixibacteraceae bacterium]
MTDRRKFLKTTAAFAAGSLMIPQLSCSSSKEKIIGLQLYTVRDKINQDLENTLVRLAEIGYNSMEAAGYNFSDGTFYGMAPKHFANRLNELGMPLHSSHSVVEPADAEKIFTDAAEAGCKYVIYPYLPEEFRKNIDGYKSTAEKFNKIGEIAKKFDIRFGYHNHAFEFENMGGQMGMDVLIAETDPKLVTFEIDLYWVTRGGYDPVDYIKKFPGRFEIYHLKDMVKTEDMFFAPVGSGRIDFESIFAVKETAGMKMFFVEQDRFRDLDPLESVELSFNYLKNAPFV